jgi:hypothetical protein
VKRIEVDRDWIEWRDALLRAEEDAAIRSARNRAATEAERLFLDALLDLRAGNARGQRPS